MTRRVGFVLAVLGCCSVPLHAQTEPQPTNEIRLVPWTDWLRTPVEDFPPHWIGLRNYAGSFVEAASSVFALTRGFETSFDANAVGQLVVRSLENRGFAAPQFGRADLASSFLVEGSPEAIDRFSDQLDELRHAIRRPVRYRIRLLEPKSAAGFGFEASSARLKPEELERLLAASRVRIDHETTRALGVPLQIGTLREREMLLEHEVESAGETAIADPRVFPVWFGPRIECLAHRTSRDDRLRLEIRTFDDFLEQVSRRRTTGVDYQGFYEAPVMRRSAIATTFPIERDEVFVALIDGPAGHGQSSAWLFEAALLDPPPSEAQIDSFPIGDLLRAREPLAGAFGVPSGESEFFVFDERPDPAVMAEELERSVGVPVVGSSLVPIGEEEQESVRTLLRMLESTRGGLLSIRASVEGPHGPVSFLIPAETGGTTNIEHVDETPFLLDHEVEISMGVMGPNPSIQILSEGVFFGATFAQTERARVHSKLASVALRLGPEEVVRLGRPRVGNVDRSDITEVPWDSTAPWPLGEWRSSKNSVDGLGNIRLRIDDEASLRR